MEYDSRFLCETFQKKDRERLLAFGIEEIKFSPADEEKYLKGYYEDSWAGYLEKAPDAAAYKALVSK